MGSRLSEERTERPYHRQLRASQIATGRRVTRAPLHGVAHSEPYGLTLSLLGSARHSGKLRVDRRFKPANVLTEEQRGDRRSGVFFFRSKLILPGG
jgi:hypothetical protein